MSERHALVTGASGGIGRAFVLALAAQGYRTTSVARSQGKLDALVAGLGAGHRALVADLSTPEGVALVVAELKRRPYDLLINNAGVGSYGVFGEAPLEPVQQMLRLNIDALVALSHAYLAGARRSDALINVSSTLAFLPLPGSAAYAASKAFVTALSDCLWHEHKGSGVYVMGLCPGVTSTDFHSRAGGSAASAPPELLTQRPEQVVATALAALRARSQPTVVTGLLNKLGALMSRLLPRRWVVALMGANAPKP